MVWRVTQMSRLCAILPWIGRVSATGSAGLATYVAFYPDIAGSYGRMAGVVAIGLFGGVIWFMGRTTVYLLGGD
jgi:hypothetical protein